jgi:hypothetical protein
MIERKYKCNLCREPFAAEELHGLHWTHKGWVKKPTLDCENHICNRCLFAVGAIAEEYEAMRPGSKPDDCPQPGEGHFV